MEGAAAFTPSVRGLGSHEATAPRQEVLGLACVHEVLHVGLDALGQLEARALLPDGGEVEVPEEHRALVVGDARAVSSDELRRRQEELRELVEVLCACIVHSLLVLGRRAEAHGGVPDARVLLHEVGVRPVQGPVDHGLALEVGATICARAVLVGQVAQDGVALGQAELPVLHGRHLAPRVDLEELLGLQLALHHVLADKLAALLVHREQDRGDDVAGYLHAIDLNGHGGLVCLSGHRHAVSLQLNHALEQLWGHGRSVGASWTPQDNSMAPTASAAPNS
mmetsp:Transcript_94434/g.211686  ORF Transcript_94434/g.211686 Transcript_94434/m.211686 type:complete len:280 (-) Transcript_94434:14-853(-)